MEEKKSRRTGGWFNALRDRLWAPFEYSSRRSVESISSAISENLEPDSTLQLIPKFGKLYGRVDQGRFKVKYYPVSAVFSRGAGRVEVKGRIVEAGNGSKIEGRLQGPPPFILALGSFSILALFGSIPFDIWMIFVEKNNEIELILFWPCLGVVLALVSFIIYIFDQGANSAGESKILEMFEKVTA